MMLRTTLAVIAGTLTIAGACPLAFAQPGKGYIGASISAFRVDADEVEGTAPAVGLSGGLAVARYVDVELEAAWPTRTFARSYSGVSVSFAPPGSPVDEFERLGVVTRYDKRRDVTVHLSAVVIIHPAGSGRLQPGLVAGVFNQRVRDETTYTTVSLPPGVDPVHSSIPRGVERSTRNVGGPTIGGQLAIAVTPHLSVVPDVRLDYGSIGDEINNTWRSAIRVNWRF